MKMECVLKISIVLLFLKTATAQGPLRLQDLQEILKKNNVESEKIDSRKSNVYINDKVCEIFFYDTSNVTRKIYHENTILKYYTCLNCQIAQWTRTELYKFMHDRFDIFHYPTSYDHVFFNHFNGDETEGKTKQIDRYINVLLNVTDAIHSPSIDRSVLTALLALRFKFDYMQKLREYYFHMKHSYHERPGETVWDLRILRTVLKSISEMETYMSLNCDVTTFYDDQMTERPQSEEPHAVLPGLESSGSHFYSLSQTLMRNALADNKDDRILYGMLYVEISVGCSRNVLLRDLVQAIEKTYELETIYWYQTLVLHITLRLVCDGMVRFLETDGITGDVPKDIQASFRIVNRLLFSEPVGVPGDVVECFRMFESKTRFTAAEAAFVTGKIKNYVNKLRKSVKLAEWMYGKTNRAERGQELAELQDASLARLLAEIERFVSDYTTFMRLYVLLNRRFHSYYAPGAMNYAKITDFVIGSGLCKWEPSDASVDRVGRRELVISKLQSLFGTAPMEMIVFTYRHEGNMITEYDPSINAAVSTLINRGCDYVQDLIKYCFNVFRVYYTAAMKEMLTDSQTFASAFSDLRKIQSALAAIVKIYPDHYFREIAHQTFPYFKVLSENFEEESTLDDTLVRVVSLIVNALNYYGLEHCYPPTHSFVMFCKSNAETASTIIDFKDNKIRTFTGVIETLKSQGTLETTESGDVVRLADLYKMYFNGREKYKNVVTVEWNGRFESVGKIHDNVISTLVRSISFYEFIDVLFKYYLAAIYYEIKTFEGYTYGGMFGQSGLCVQRVDKNVLGKTDFPDYLQTISVRLGHYLKHVFDKVCDGRSPDTGSEDPGAAIVRRFEEIGVRIDDGNVDPRCQRSSEYLKTTINGILQSVSSMKNTLNDFTIYTT